MFTVLWCYLRNAEFKQADIDYHVAADLTGQANHIGVTIEADIIKQKLPENNGGYNALKGYGKTSKLVYDTLTTDHPIDLTRWQVANCYMGRAGLINSGGASSGESDLAEAVRTAVINKRAGGTGLISGRKAFQRPMAEGHRAPQRDPGRLPRPGDHGRIRRLRPRPESGRIDQGWSRRPMRRAATRRPTAPITARYAACTSSDPVHVAEHERPFEHDTLVERREPDHRLEAGGILVEREERRREEEQRDEREGHVVEVDPRPHERGGREPGAREREADQHRGRHREQRPPRRARARTTSIVSRNAVE